MYVRTPIYLPDHRDRVSIQGVEDDKYQIYLLLHVITDDEPSTGD